MEEFLLNWGFLVVRTIFILYDNLPLTTFFFFLHELISFIMENFGFNYLGFSGARFIAIYYYHIAKTFHDLGTCAESDVKVLLCVVQVVQKCNSYK